ncbi:hypothetical protein FISHEDRAFT_8490, partial [Fistulina hepatica ATCC 64428]
SLLPLDAVSASRLQALYSDFSRQKSSNPTAYNANISWWMRALEEIMRNGSSSRFVLNADQRLMDSLRVARIGKPLGLRVAVAHLTQTRTLIPIVEFFNATQSVYSSKSRIPSPTTVINYVVGKPLWWGLEQLGVVGEDSLFSSLTSSAASDVKWSGEFVYLPHVEATADGIQAVERSRSGDGLYNFESFRLAFGADSMPLCEMDTKVMLKYLERDRRALIVDLEQDVIKFVETTASPVERIITAVDRGVLELKAAVSNLHKQIDDIQKRMEECTSKSRAALQAKQRPLALTYLRSRKELEGLLNRRAGSLATLESTLISVEGARGDAEIVKAYSSSTATLRMVLSHPSLQREEIEKTMEAMAEANADACDVRETVELHTQTAVGMEAADDTDIERELAELVKEQ